MEKLNILPFIASILMVFVMYLGGAFVHASFDITKWSETGKEIVGSFGAIVLMAGITSL